MGLGLQTSLVSGRHIWNPWTRVLGEFVMIGDINFHLNNKSNPDTKAFLSLLEADGLVQHITTPTHIKGHVLDMVVTCEGSCILRAEPDVFPSGVGDDEDHVTLDHYAKWTRLQSRFPKPAVKAITYRKTKTVPIAEFRESVRCAVLSRNVDNLVTTYNTDMGNVLDKYAPLIKKTVSARKTAPWYTRELRAKKQSISTHGKSNAQKEKEFHCPIS